MFVRPQGFKYQNEKKEKLQSPSKYKTYGPQNEGENVQ